VIQGGERKEEGDIAALAPDADENEREKRGNSVSRKGERGNLDLRKSSIASPDPGGEKGEKQFARQLRTA